MSGTRILPDLQCSLLCEDVRQEMNGNFMVAGIISHITVPQLPVGVMKLCIFNRWTAGMGQFTENVKLVAPDQSTVLLENKGKFELKGPDAAQISVHAFGNIQFKDAGTYQVEVTVDDVLKLRYPVPLQVIPPKEPTDN